MNDSAKKQFEFKIKSEIKELKNIQMILQFKRPSYDFLAPTINNSIASLVDLLVYLENKNPYYKEFNVDFFNYRQTAMHREFFSNLFIDTEAGIREVINILNIKVNISRQEKVVKIVASIRNKVKEVENIENELKSIIDLGGKFPTFNDYLNTMLIGIKKLDRNYAQQCRIYFDALNIIRNKISHSDENLSENEKVKLIKAKFAKAIGKDNLLQMTFEGYKLLLNDIIRLFDHIYAYI